MSEEHLIVHVHQLDNLRTGNRVVRGLNLRDGVGTDLSHFYPTVLHGLQETVCLCVEVKELVYLDYDVGVLAVALEVVSLPISAVRGVKAARIQKLHSPADAGIQSRVVHSSSSGKRKAGAISSTSFSVQGDQVGRL